MSAAAYALRELDDLVLHLKGLLLVRGVREERGADPDELAMYGAEIDRVREQLAAFVKEAEAAAAEAA